jgi:hypothetical protein
MTAKSSAQAPQPKVYARGWSKKIKDAIESVENYKNRKLTDDEKSAVKYLTDTIELSDWRNDRGREKDSGEKIDQILKKVIHY